MKRNEVTSSTAEGSMLSRPVSRHHCITLGKHRCRGGGVTLLTKRELLTGDTCCLAFGNLPPDTCCLIGNWPVVSLATCRLSCFWPLSVVSLATCRLPRFWQLANCLAGNLPNVTYCLVSLQFTVAVETWQWSVSHLSLPTRRRTEAEQPLLYSLTAFLSQLSFAPETDN